MSADAEEITDNKKMLAAQIKRIGAVRMFQPPRIIISLLLLTLLTACSSIKTIHEWKDPTYAKKLHTVLVISVVEQDYMRRQYENFITLKLNALGIAAIPSYKVLPEHGTEITREEVVEKVRQLDVDTVLVSRSIMKDSVANYQPDGAYFAATGVYMNGWYTVYVGSVIYPVREYDIDYFTIATTLFDVQRNKPIWSDLSRIKVSGSRQAAINRFVPALVQKLDESQLLE
ncbi:MAG: hypothetical protein KAG93_04905 [Desulfuromusa sp.]|nr:hypothetical protein [Desulfuromusa sp.]